jgi:hypothetical protein
MTPVGKSLITHQPRVKIVFLVLTGDNALFSAVDLGGASGGLYFRTLNSPRCSYDLP